MWLIHDSLILTWVVLKVLEVDVGDVLVLHQVHLQVVLRAVHLVVGACNVSPSISILFCRIKLIGWLYLTDGKLPRMQRIFGKITGFYPNDFAQLANGIWLWVSFEKSEKPGKILQKTSQAALGEKVFENGAAAGDGSDRELNRTKTGEVLQWFRHLLLFVVALLEMSSSTPFIINTFYCSNWFGQRIGCFAC